MTRLHQSKTTIAIFVLGISVGIFILTSLVVMRFTPYIKINYQIALMVIPLALLAIASLSGLINAESTGTIVMLASLLLIYNITINSVLFHQSERAITSKIADFKRDPDGFIFIKKYALNNFQTRLVLNEDTDSYWLDFVYIANPAATTPSKGSCPLYILPNKIADYFNPGKEVSSDAELLKAWTKGILVHELGHCLDVYRDYPSDFLSQDFQLNAIHPNFRNKIKSFDDYSDVEMDNNVSNWREAFADIMAIGFWKINYPSQAKVLTDALLNRRIKNLNLDHPSKNTHDTACWIEHIKNQNPPQFDKDLFMWSDNARSDSEGCLKIQQSK